MKTKRILFIHVAIFWTVLFLLMITAAYSQSNIKIGYIQYKKIANRLFNQQDLNKKLRGIQNDVERAGREHTYRIKYLTEQRCVFKNQPESRAKARNLKDLESDVLRENSDYKKWIATLEQRKDQISDDYKYEIYKDIKAKIKLFAETNGYTHIFDKPNSWKSPSLLYGPTNLNDITDNFLAEMFTQQR